MSGIENVTAAQAYAALSAALRAGDMKAAVDLLHVVAVKDPRGAQLIVDTVRLLASGDLTPAPVLGVATDGPAGDRAGYDAGGAA